MNKITVDGKVYRSTQELVDKLDLGIPTKRLYYHFTRLKYTFTAEELDAAVKWIKENTKKITTADKTNKAIAEINLAEVMYNLLYTTSDYNTLITDFILLLPVAEVSEEGFKKYFSDNYSRIQPYIDEKYTLSFLFNLIEQYKQGSLSPDLKTYTKNVHELVKQGKCMPITYYMKKYHLGYGMVYGLRKDYLEGASTYEEFIKGLEEKTNRVSKKKGEKIKQGCSNI